MATDRNQKARENFELARLRREFQQAFSSGQINVFDRFGNPLREGQMVLAFPAHNGVAMRIGAITPVLDPGAQPGLVRVMLTCTLPAQYFGGQTTDLIVLRSSEPAPAPAGDGAGDGPTAEEPTPAAVPAPGDEAGTEEQPPAPPAIVLTDDTTH